MKRTALILSVLCVAIGAFVANTWADDCKINVHPQILNMFSKGSWVTVQTDIMTDDESQYECELNGIGAFSKFINDCGELVCKFDLPRVKRTLDVEDGAAIMAFRVWIPEGYECDAQDIIKVINVSQEGDG